MLGLFGFAEEMFQLFRMVWEWIIGQLPYEGGHPKNPEELVTNNFVFTIQLLIHVVEDGSCKKTKKSFINVMNGQNNVNFQKINVINGQIVFSPNFLKINVINGQNCYVLGINLSLKAQKAGKRSTAFSLLMAARPWMIRSFMSLSKHRTTCFSCSFNVGGWRGW